MKNILAQRPPIHQIRQLPLPAPERQELANGLILHELQMGSQEVLKIEWLFQAGRWFEEHKLQARATAALLRAGAGQRTADELADFFDFYGAKLKVSDDFDSLSIRLYCLSKHLPKLLAVIMDLLLDPQFEQEELDQFQQLSKQRLRIQLQRNELQAYRIFTEKLFGSKHPYGYNSEAEDYNTIDRDRLLAHHRRCFLANNCQVIVSGKTDAATMDLLKTELSRLPHGTPPQGSSLLLTAAEIGAFHYPAIKAESQQASIRIGRRALSQKSPDYAAFHFTNTLLGGYYGARLMQNLREDKGYTYSVYSAEELMRHAGYFYIYTDVAKEVKTAALTEIYKEIDRLQEETVSEEEMQMLKNYSLGMFLSATDGVFNLSEVWKELILSGLDASFYNQLVEATLAMPASEVMRIAQTYLQKEQLTEVVFG